MTLPWVDLRLSHSTIFYRPCSLPLTIPCTQVTITYPLPSSTHTAINLRCFCYINYIAKQHRKSNIDTKICNTIKCNSWKGSTFEAFICLSILQQLVKRRAPLRYSAKMFCVIRLSSFNFEFRSHFELTISFGKLLSRSLSAVMHRSN